MGVSSARPQLARAGTVAIFYYPWYGDAARPTAPGEHWNQNGHRPPGDLYSRFYPALGPYSSSDPPSSTRQMTRDRAAGIDEIVVSWWGRGSRRGRAPAARASRRRARHGLLVGDPPRAVRGPHAPHRSPLDLALPRRRSACATSTSTTRATSRRRTGRAVRAADALDDAALRRAPRRSASRPPAASTASTPMTSSRTPARSSRACARRRTRCTSLCAPSVGPGYDGHRAGEPPPGRTRQNGSTYDRLWTAALARAPGRRHDHELQRVGRGHADRARPGPARLRRATTAPGASSARRPRPRTSCGRRTGPARFHARYEVGRHRRLVGDGYPRGPRAARAAAERPDARAARADPGLRRPHGARQATRTAGRPGSSSASRASPTRSTASSRAAGTSSRASARSPTRSPTG